MMLALVLMTSVLLPQEPIRSDNTQRIFEENVRYYWTDKEVYEAAVSADSFLSATERHLPNKISIYFDFDSYLLKEKERAKLENLRKGVRVKLEGHASPEGSKKYNFELSRKRVESVRSALKKRGVNVIETKAFGEDMCKEERRNWWKCRRVDIKIKTK